MIPITNLINVLPWHPTRKWGKRSLKRINKLIIHQSLGEGSIEQVNNYHITAPNHISKRGCPHICYHYCIRRNGEIVQANNLSAVTWHCKGENTRAIGIMLIGNFNGSGYTLGTSEPSTAQLDSIGGLVDYLLSEFDLSRQDVYGHYHFGKPACPGTIAQQWVENKRNEVDEELVENQVELTTTEVQRRLNLLGYEAGLVDGIHGIKTATAIRRFQTENGLASDGVVGPKTWKVLIEQTA